jgi:predicted CXXCH cytochrome family protein
MLNGLFKRLIIGLVCSVLTLSLVLAVSAADGPSKEGPIRTDCIECHESVVTHWQDSSHGQAASNSAFLQAWGEKGSPEECLSCHTTNYDPETGTSEEDAIACGVCHFGQTGPHPETAMPTDPSSRLCGTCHIDTFDQWQVSAHGEGELTCVRCHNPHTTSLKTGTMEDLCITCHNEEAYYYNFTSHAQEGLSCNDCHFRVSDSEMGNGHGRRLHTWEVDLETCSECHGLSMHFPSIESQEGDQAMMWTTFASEDEESGSTPTPLIDEPERAEAGPFNYLVVAAVGMGFGIAVTPWAEKWYRRLISKD